MDEITQYWSIFRRRWLPASTRFTAVVATTALATPIYEAKGQILLKKTDSTSSLLGGKRIGELDSLTNGSNHANTQAELIRSIPVSQETIASLDLSEDLTSFLKTLKVSNIKSTDILQASYQSTELEQAAKIINNVMGIYIKNDIISQGTETKAAREFVENQLPKIEHHVQQSEQELRGFKEQNQVRNLESEASSITQKITELNKQLISSQAELASTNAEFQGYRQLFKDDVNTTTNTVAVSESTAVQKALADLQQIQQKLALERIRFQEQHPIIVELKIKEAALQDLLKEQSKLNVIGTQPTPGKLAAISPQSVQETLVKDFVSTQTDRNRLQQQVHALAQIEASYKQRIHNLPKLEQQQRELERKLKAAQSTYEILLAKTQEIRVTENQNVDGKELNLSSINKHIDNFDKNLQEKSTRIDLFNNQPQKWPTLFVENNEVYNDSNQKGLFKDIKLTEYVESQLPLIYENFSYKEELSSSDYNTLNSASERVDSELTNLSSSAKTPEAFKLLPVGININRRSVTTSTFVRGQEDGSQAIDFDKWLLPYETIIQGLKLTTKVLPDNQIELRSPSLVVRIDPTKLQNDPELGLVFSVAQVRSIFGVEIEFDINEYAIQIEADWLNRSRQTQILDTPVEIEGLPRLSANQLTIGAIEQRLDASGRETISPTYTGNLAAVGSIFGGSWFLRTTQPEFFNQNTWKINEARYQRQTNYQDFIAGSQPSFWSSLSPSDYWGFTFIQRQGFIPPVPLYGESDPRLRLQSNQIGRTISGKAEPGTLVRLVQGFDENAIAEVLVDSSGIYRFENIRFDNRSFGNYRVLLYPQGRLSAIPEIRAANFSSLPGQIPAGSSALIVSGGFRREFSNSQLDMFGNFSEFQGGISQRWGLSNELTVGLGTVYDGSIRGMGEIFFQPERFPLKVAISALTDNDDSPLSNINADISFEPSQNFNARFSHDRFSSRLNAYWQVFPGVALIANTDTSRATAAGLQLSFSGKNAFTFASVTIDTKNRFNWNLLQRLGRLGLRTTGNEIGSQSELSYYLSPFSDFTTGHSLVLGYETRSQNKGDDIATIGWRYQSKQKSIDGTPLWQTQLGYGVGSRGSGLIASVGTTVLPGLLLQLQYEGISLTSDESAFRLQLVSSLNLQRGITPGDRRLEYFRTMGGMLLQPFFDRNDNGKRDSGEEVYTDNPDLLIVNNKPIKSLQVERQRDRLLARLPPGTYRLDLDPAGFPPDWQAKVDALAVDVVAGSYTPVPVPLVQSYAISGVITDTEGKPINGARVEARSNSSEQRVFSVTNGAGVYYLERLQQGTYTLQINGKPAQPNSINIDISSQPFQELNLKQQ